ncbi:hypothetical protein BWI17_18045 [Betaproteobacteria bacterium GR16-43]|nr:hypothetical protein BWI17_18045 [Betaproteobacteria bacterium GR16-43]
MSSRLWDADVAGAAKPWKADALVKPAARAAKASPANELEARRRLVAEAARAEGHAQGLREGQAQVRAEAAKLTKLLANARASWDRLEGAIAEPVVDLAVEIARQVLRADPKLRREALATVVRESIACLAEDSGTPRIVLHPSDVESLKAHVGEELARGEWIITEDLRMEPGGCRIVTGSGEVDATMSTRWRRVVASLGREAPWMDDREAPWTDGDERY